MGLSWFWQAVTVNNNINFFTMKQNKKVLITGAAKRIGAACAKRLHAQGCSIYLHYHSSATEARALAGQLNAIRPDSVYLFQANLDDQTAIIEMVEQIVQLNEGVDVLINNASSFFPMAFDQVAESDWDQMMACNVKAPFFLIQQLSPHLSENQGCVVNIIDIHAERGLPGFPVYSLSKATLAAMTKMLAKELGPNIRMNAVSPGAILWPDHSISNQEKKEILDKVVLNRLGSVEDIANAVNYLVFDADYLTGQIISVDGGRTLCS